MRDYLPVLLSTVLLALASQTSAQRPTSKPTSRPEPYRLPADPDAVVLSLDYAGGFNPRHRTKPNMTVHTDGSVRVRGLFGTSDEQQRVGHLSAVELHTLLHEVLDEHELDRWDGEAVARAVQALEKSGDIPRVADALTTVVCVHLPDHEVHVERYALDVVAPRAPEVAALQHLFSVSNRLRALAAMVEIGSERADKLCEVANEALREQAEQSQSETQPFALSDLRTATHSRDGVLRVTFYREYVDADGEGFELGAVVTVPPGGAPKAEIQDERRH